MRFEVTILGSNSATPAFGRNQTSQLLNCNEIYYLIDCGEGTQLQLQRYGLKANRIRHIFISHLHGDHYLGLMGLISSMHLNGRRDELHLYGPAPLKEIIDIQLRHSETRLEYPLVFHATSHQSPALILENEDLLVKSFPLQHRIACTGFLFVEQQRLPRIIKEKVEQLAVPKIYYSQIKKGIDYTDKQGVTHAAANLTSPAPMPRSYAFCSDTACSWLYLEYIMEVDLLYHEATFMNDLEQRASETFHTTAGQAAQVATRAGAKALLIGHFSSRYRSLDLLLAESQSLFPNTKIAIEGQTYPIV